MLAGISTACMYPQYTEISMRQLADMPVQCTEVFINCAQELHIPYLHELRRIARDGGVRILSLHPYTSGMEPMYFFSQYDRRFEEGREIYKRYYEAAGELGADIVVFHGGHRGVHMEPAQYFERFGRLLQDARAQGVELCHENVARCTSHTPSFFTALSAVLPEARFVFDVKQAVRAGEDPIAFAQVMGRKIRHVHISDHAPHKDCLPPGAGVFNIGELLNLLRRNAFSGGVIVELYRENFGDFVELKAAYQLLCTEISTALNNH